MTNEEPGPSRIKGLDAAREEIFQYYKRHIIVTPTEATFPNIDPQVQQQALNLLESQKIIFRPNPSDPSITQINPIVTSASSYNEAVTIIEEKGERGPIKITPIITDGAHKGTLVPAKNKKLKTVWIIIAIIVVLFLLFSFVPFYKWI